MEPGKHSSSDISSSETDHQPEKSGEDSTGVGRSYECTFCKRGFTNAQALGGHMNIHRKDKAKAAKQKNHEEPSNVKNIKRNEDYGNLRYLGQISSTDHQQEQTGYYGPVGGQFNYQVYLPSSSPSSEPRNYLSVWRPEVEGHADPNLSLRIGLSPPESGEGGYGDENEKENEVDLELRLGHDP